MALSAGTRIGPYQIVSLAGAGGMGEVYRARDPKLERDVALKLLPEAFAGDPDRAARFEREAKLLAALNHPNIASIYGFESGALVMELVEGVSPQGPMSFDDAWHIASQIIAALEYAHERGIIHRDLKPANIKVTADGVVKLLDFGLAKVFAEPVAGKETNLSNSPTLTMATEVGVILGTAAYMAPEQAKGKTVDKRADIWAFGAVFYELLTGEQLFQAEDVSETLARVLTKQPDWNKVPLRARPLLEACLEKDVKRRLRDIGDGLRLLKSETAPPIAIESRKPISSWIFAAAAVVLLTPAAILSWIHFRETPPAQPFLSATIEPPEGTTFDFNFTNGVGTFVLSPDGRKLVLRARGPNGNSQLWLRSLDTFVAQPLPGTEGATFPFWSPDNRFIAFFADGQLKKLDISGGPPVKVADAMVGRGGTWSKDNVIVFSPTNNDPLQKVSASGGPATPVTKYVTEDGPQRLPWFLPDGKHFLYRVQGVPSSNIRIGSLDSMEPKIVGASSSAAVYAGGHLFFRRDTTLMAQPFDDKTLSLTGEAIPIAENVNVNLSAGYFSVSDSGILVYQSSKTVAAAQAGEFQNLVWVDREGKELAKLREPGNIADIQLSPDRTKFAYTLWGNTPTNRDIWVYDIARQLPSRFTFDAAPERYPIWAPDGKSLIFTRGKDDGGARIYRKTTEVTGTEQVIWDSRNAAPTSWSPDGNFVLINTFSPTGLAGTHIWKVPVMPERPGQVPMPSPFLDSGSFTETDGQFSPDGRWVAYSSNESQRYEIYVTTFPEAGGKKQISIEGGINPRWSADGKQILFIDQNSTLTSAEITIKGGSIDVGQIRPVIRGVINQRGYLFDVSQDGSRILVNVLSGALVPRALAALGSEPLTLISNWRALLKK
jgi:serine/threonine protein kinase